MHNVEERGLSCNESGFKKSRTEYHATFPRRKDSAPFPLVVAPRPELVLVSDCTCGTCESSLTAVTAVPAALTCRAREDPEPVPKIPSGSFAPLPMPAAVTAADCGLAEAAAAVAGVEAVEVSRMDEASRSRSVRSGSAEG